MEKELHGVGSISYLSKGFPAVSERELMLEDKQEEQFGSLSLL